MTDEIAQQRFLRSNFPGRSALHPQQLHPPHFDVCEDKGIQVYLAHKKPHPPRTLPWAYAEGPRGVLGGWAFSTATFYDVE